MNPSNVNTITMDIPLFIRMLEYAKEDAKTDMDLHSATERAIKLCKDGKPLTMNNYNSIVNLKKTEPKEQTTSGSSGSFEGTAFSNKPIKKIDKIHNSSQEEIDEVTDSSSSGQYDVPLFGGTKGRKNPLSIGGEGTIADRAKTINKTNFPKWGGPGGVFVKIKDKCKKFPYCNQGDINAIEILHEAINEVSLKYNVPVENVEKIVLKEIKRIFI